MYVTSAAAALFGLWVVWKRPREKLNRLFFFLALSVAWWAFGYGHVLQSATPMEALKWAHFGICGAIIIPPLFYHFMLCFLRRTEKLLLRAIYAGSVVFLLLSQFPFFLTTPTHYVWGYYPRAGPVYIFFIGYFYIGFGLALKDILFVYRELKSHPKPYISVDQVKYVFRAYCLATCSISDYLPNYGIPIYPFAYLAAIGWLVTMAYAVLRYRLMDLRLILRKTLIYTVVSVFVTVAYFLSTSLMAGLSAAYFGRHSFLEVALFSGFLTVTFLPLFRWIQYVVDRLFFRFKIDREAKLMQFSAEIVQVDNLDSMTRSLYRVVEEALHPKSMALYLRLADKPDYMEVAQALSPNLPMSLAAGNIWEKYFRKDPQAVIREAGTLAPDIHEAMERSGIFAAVPLIRRQDVLGFLLLGEKRSEEPYSNEDIVLLRIVLNQATIAYEKPKLIKEMTSGFAHEIKMPLANIALPAELTFIEVGQALDGKRSTEEVLSKIQRRMKYIMDQTFLASHRVDALQAMAGRDRSAFEPIPLDGFIQRCAESLHEWSAEKGCRLTIHVGKLLPVIYGDQRQLEIAFVNVLKNGVEAAVSHASPQPAVSVNVSTETPGVKIDIQDNGPGVGPDHEAAIFDPYFSTKGSHGTGMGLYLARQIAEQHGGYLRLIKEAPSTCFRFYLPENNA